MFVILKPHRLESMIVSNGYKFKLSLSYWVTVFSWQGKLSSPSWQAPGCPAILGTPGTKKSFKSTLACTSLNSFFTLEIVYRGSGRKTKKGGGEGKEKGR